CYLRSAIVPRCDPPRCNRGPSRCNLPQPKASKRCAFAMWLVFPTNQYGASVPTNKAQGLLLERLPVATTLQRQSYVRLNPSRLLKYQNRGSDGKFQSGVRHPTTQRPRCRNWLSDLNCQGKSRLAQRSRLLLLTFDALPGF